MGTGLLEFLRVERNLAIAFQLICFLLLLIFLPFGPPFNLLFSRLSSCCQPVTSPGENLGYSSVLFEHTSPISFFLSLFKSCLFLLLSFQFFSFTSLIYSFHSLFKVIFIFSSSWFGKLAVCHICQIYLMVDYFLM